MEDLRISIRVHNMSTYEPCVLCGEYYRQAHAAAVLHDGPEWLADGHIGDVCPGCIAAGPEGAADRARQRAAFLRECAGNLETLADSLRVTPWAAVAEFLGDAENLVTLADNLPAKRWPDVAELDAAEHEAARAFSGGVVDFGDMTGDIDF